MTVAPIDHAKLIERMGGDEQLRSEVIRLFLEESAYGQRPMR